MNPSKEDIDKIGIEENDRWQTTYKAIVKEVVSSNKDFQNGQNLARELNAEIVATTRDEDKWQLASDEAVAYKLSKMRKNKTEGLDSLIDQPYFARVVTKEEDGRKVEFRLSTASFPEQRIIDWRKAPISKLYYDYEQGEEFCEEIQGQEREGIIELRRAYHGERDCLFTIDIPEGQIRKDIDTWILDTTGESLSRGADHDGHLPPILSLITADQFALITRDPEKPIVIQGIAGSGKTTVALHRLAWLLHEDNSDARPENCLVVMLNRSLKKYVETTLPELKITGVPIKTFYQWAGQLASDIMGQRPRENFQFSSQTNLFKSSQKCLDLMVDYIQQSREKNDFMEDLFGYFEFVINKSQDDIVRDLQQQLKVRKLDYQDDAILLHLIFLRKGCYPTRLRHNLSDFDHIVLDEVQDFGIVEIKAMLNALKPDRAVTLVGDIAQKIDMERSFESWETILAEAGFKDTTPIELNISYRTTEEIMTLARHVRGEFPNRDEVSAQTKRHGEAPKFIHADSPEVIPELTKQWIQEKVQKNPRTLCAIVCRKPQQAKDLAQKLQKLGLPSIRWSHRDEFEFTPGIIVTNTHQIKGLEFRHVLIVDPTEEQYAANNPEEKNLLYVAVTRAELSLDFISSGELSSLIPMDLIETVEENENMEETQNVFSEQPDLFDSPDD